jgi:hypothetical protein
MAQFTPDGLAVFKPTQSLPSPSVHQSLEMPTSGSTFASYSPRNSGDIGPLAHQMAIAQIEAPAPGQAARTLTFAEDLLPVGKVSFSVEQRGTKRMYPFSAQASVHLSGPDLGSTSFDFEWWPDNYRTKAWLDSTPLHTRRALLDAMQALTADTALVQLTFGGWQRVGFLRKCTPTEGRADRAMKVTLTVEWVASTAFPMTPSMEPIASSGNSALSQLTSLWDQGTSGRRSAAGKSFQDIMGATNPTVGKLNSGPLSDLAGGLGDLEGALGQFAVYVRPPQAPPSSPGAGGLGTLIAQGAQSVQEKAANLKSIAGQVASVVHAVEDPAEMIGVQAGLAALARMASRMEEVAGATARLQRRLAEDRILAIHRTLPGEDLRLLAFRMYGDASAWRGLCTYNKLSGPQPPAGTEVLLPPKDLIWGF